MRGSLEDAFKALAPSGIIPAHAGLTHVVSGYPACTRDHPRACGAHTARAFIDYLISGSSPRMRGSHVWAVVVGEQPGIIPAHAGLTGTALRQQDLSRDHPRACGAHIVFHHIAHWIKGSSPRMRGSHYIKSNLQFLHGIIPAHAGLTVSRCCRERPPWDHPRACGAHSRSCERAGRCMGSSPRMRGSLRCNNRAGKARGIIPAHAGLTIA